MHPSCGFLPSATPVPAASYFDQNTSCNGSKVELGVSVRLGVLKNVPSCSQAQVV